ncbi:MAG TPA: tyrosine-type recombinase/integrase [Acidimicrobiales bacterium]|nr:tyrosine-type recombinase/integrase [Acidimicrobiales bacterium]
MRTLSASPATSKLEDARQRPWHAASRPWPASTATQTKKACCHRRQQRTCAARGSTTSPTPPASTATTVDALLVAAGLASARDHALISLLAINGLRVSEALGANIEALGIERGHRTVTVLRKGGKTVVIPLAPCTARAIDLAIGERVEGPIFLATNGDRLDRHAAWRIVPRLARKAGINKPVRPHTLRHAFITAALDAGVPLRDVQEAASHADSRTTMRYGRARGLPRPPRHLRRRRLPGRRRQVGRGQLTFKKRRSASRTISDGVVSS